MNRKRPSSRTRRPVATAARRAIELLERRQLMSVTLDSQERLTTAVGPILAHTASAASDSVTLSSHFTDDKVPGTVVTFSTTAGNVVVALTDQATPLTVANFLSYVNSGAYNGTIVHRSVTLATSMGGSPATPSDIIQGGGYSIQNGSLSHITTSAAIADEYTTRAFGDTDGTLALAKTGNADSATSEFFFNNNDNTSALDTPTPSMDGNGLTSYTPFGVILSGTDVVKAIASLNTYQIDTTTFPTVPVTGITEAQIKAMAALTANNLIFTNSVTAVAGTTYTVASDDPSLVTPTLAGGVLSFAYGSGKTGVADVTVTAKNFDGTSVTTTFPITVPGTATTPTAVAYTAPVVVTGTTQTINPLAPDTSTAAAAFDPTGLTVTTPPAHGTATVDTAGGRVFYTPAAGYTGTDSLQYTVTDTTGAISNVATVTLTAVPTAVQVPLGGANPTVLTYTQPDGAVATIRLSGRRTTAVVTFTDYQVTLNRANYTASGPGAVVTNINIVGGGQSGLPSIGITSSRPITIGGVTDTSAVQQIVAPTTTFTGTTSIGGGLGGGIALFDVAGLSGATLDLANHVFGTRLIIPTAVNSSLTAVNVFSLTSNSWAVTDGGTYTVQANSISRLQVATAFADTLRLTGGGYDVVSARVGTPSAPWQFSGSLFNAQLTNPTAAWSLNANGIVQKLNVTGNLSSTVSAAAINSLAVTGNLANAVVQTNAAFSARSVQLRSLRVGGTISSSIVFATGNVGTITAAAVTGSRFYAGISNTVAQNSALPTAAAADILVQATIQAITLPTTGTFAASEIGAYTVRSAHLGQVTAANGGTPFGIAAHVAHSVYANFGSGNVLNVGTPQLRSAATLAAYVTAQRLTLGDFVVSLF